MTNSYKFKNNEAAELEESLIYNLELSIENYRKVISEIMEKELQFYEGQLINENFSENEIKALLDFQVRKFEKVINDADKIKLLLEDYKNNEIVFHNKTNLINNILEGVGC